MFVTIEGLDGSGKSTVLDAITDKYPTAVTTSEPSDLEYGKLVRRNLSDPETHELVDFYLFMVDRVNHIKERVEPAEREGKLVVSDRYADSTRAYQPVALTGENGPFDSQFEAKAFIERTMKVWNYEPELTLYIDVSPETACERMSGDEKYEVPEFLKQVHDNYNALADSDEYGDRIVRIDGEQSKEDVRTSALGKLDVVAPDRL